MTKTTQTSRAAHMLKMKPLITARLTYIWLFLKDALQRVLTTAHFRNFLQNCTY